MKKVRQAGESGEVVKSNPVRRVMLMRGAPSVKGDEPPEVPAILRGIRTGEKRRRVIKQPAVGLAMKYPSGAPTVRIGGRSVERKGRAPLQNPVAGVLAVRDGSARARLEALRVSRIAANLIDQGATAGEVARRCGVDLATALRLVRRHELLSRRQGPEEVILQRAVGEQDTATMLRVLQGMGFTTSPPPPSSADDSSTPDTGTVRQLLRARQERLLTADEYEWLRRSVRVDRVGP